MLRELFDRFWPALYRQARVLLAPDLDPEDAAAEVWLRVVEDAATFRPEGSVYGWLARICTSVCLDRRRSPQRFWLLRAVLGAAGQGRPRPSRPARDAAARERFEALHRAVHALPNREREAIVLRFFFETSVTEIAVLLRLGPDATKKAIVRGLRRLRTSRGAPALRALLAARGGGA